MSESAAKRGSFKVKPEVHQWFLDEQNTFRLDTKGFKADLTALSLMFLSAYRALATKEISAVLREILENNEPLSNKLEKLTRVWNERPTGTNVKFDGLPAKSSGTITTSDKNSQVLSVSPREFRWVTQFVHILREAAGESEGHRIPEGRHDFEVEEVQRNSKDIDRGVAEIIPGGEAPPRTGGASKQAGGGRRSRRGGD